MLKSETVGVKHSYQEIDAAARMLFVAEIDLCPELYDRHKDLLEEFKEIEELLNWRYSDGTPPSFFHLTFLVKLTDDLWGRTRMISNDAFFV